MSFLTVKSSGIGGFNTEAFHDSAKLIQGFPNFICQRFLTTLLYENIFLVPATHLISGSKNGMPKLIVFPSLI